jgi:AraC family transcriptional regulator
MQSMKNPQKRRHSGYDTGLASQCSNPQKQTLSSKGALSPVSADRLQEFLRRNFTQLVTIADLAAVAGCSSAYLARAFAKTFGLPPHRYLINLRLDLAEKLLLASTISLADIAYQTGFSSQSHLTTAMRQYRGHTPAQLRVVGSVKSDINEAQN